MPKYSYITDKSNDNRKIQVESAIRDGDGKNIVNNYAKQNGNYQTMTVGLANNLDTKVVQNDIDAYIFRTSGGSLEIGDTCKVKSIVGGTVAFNQLGILASSMENYTGLTVTRLNDYQFKIDGTASNSNLWLKGSYSATATLFTIFAGHKYLSQGIALFTKEHTVPLAFNNFYTSQILTTNANADISAIRISSIDSITFSNYLFTLKIIDLTQMFGSTIADYIYSLEQANAGSGVAWFKRYFQNTYYAYNAGTLVNVQTSGKKYVGFNQWDEQWKLGAYNTATGAFVEDTTHLACKNKIRVVERTTYYFNTNGFNANVCVLDENEKLLYNSTSVNNSTITIPSSGYYVVFNLAQAYGTTYNHDICINFHYDGERDGEYEPYNSNEYSIEDIELRGIPLKDAQGNLYFDGDEYNSNGTENVKYCIVDLGTLTWTRETLSDISKYRYIATLPSGANISDLTRGVTSICSKYTLLEQGQTSNPNKTGYCISGSLLVHDQNNDTLTVDAFKTAMAGVYLVYQLTTPITASLNPFTETQSVDNWGTEQYLPPASDTRPCVVPVGHNTDYLLDIRSKVEIMPDSPTNDGVYVVETSSGVNEYIPLGAYLSSEGYVKQEDLSSGITDKAGLYYVIKKVYKTGKVVNLCVTAVNITGSTIAHGTTLFSLASGLYNTSGNNRFVVSLTAVADISQTGDVTLTADLVNTGAIYLEVSYIVN